MARLTNEQIEIIRRIAKQFFDENVCIRVFGSRTHDNLKGGDIDLFFETQLALPNRADVICKIYAALVLAMGDRKIDILIKDANTPPARIFEIAQQTGIVI